MCSIWGMSEVRYVRLSVDIFNIDLIQVFLLMLYSYAKSELSYILWTGLLRNSSLNIYTLKVKRLII